MRVAFLLGGAMVVASVVGPLLNRRDLVKARQRGLWICGQMQV
jgi:hypothetical protein